MARTARKKKRWTVMVYLAGDNNLDGAGVADLTEMKKVGSTRDLSVVAQFDRAGDKRVTNRYVLQKDTPLAQDVVTALGETNTGDPAVLRDFVTWAAAEHPAAHYLLVIWNHGAGWDDSNLYAGDYFSGAAPPVIRKGALVPVRAKALLPVPPVRMGTVRAAFKRAPRSLFRSTVTSMLASRAIAFDDQAQDFLDNIELKRVLADVRRVLKQKIDVLGFDACLMSMVEVAYQLRDSVGLICGSEEEEPNEGWPYDTILGALAAKPSMTPPELAKLIVARYLASYRPSDGVTLAASSAPAIAALARAINGLGRALGVALADEAARSALVTVRAQVQEYSAPYDQYCDLGDLCSLLARHVKGPGVKPACDAVRAALGRAVIASGARGPKVARSRGLSVYFPKKVVSPLYATLDFSKRSPWMSFIGAYTSSVSRRR